MTETMDTEIHNTREMLRRFYGDKKFAQIEEEMKQKVKAEVEAKQKREYEKAFKAAWESGFKAGWQKTTISIATRMFNNGFTVKSIMTACDLSEHDAISIRDHGCLPEH